MSNPDQPSPPTTTSAARIISMRKDPWIVLPGILLGILLSLQKSESWPRVSTTNALELVFVLGYILGSIVGSMLTVFLAGLLIEMVFYCFCRKSRGAGRVGFIVGAGVITFAALAQQAQYQQNRFARTHNTAILLNAMNTYLDEAKRRHEIANQRIAGIREEFLNAGGTNSADKIAILLEKVQQLRTFIDEDEKAEIAATDAIQSRITALPISDKAKNAAISKYRESSSHTKQLIHDGMTANLALLSETEGLFDFLKSRVGKFRISGGAILFDDDKDLKQYSEFAAKINQSGQMTNEIALQAMQSWDDAIRSLAEFLY